MTHTVANTETAMCLWEAMCAELEGGSLYNEASSLMEENGTPAARHVVMSWIEECEAEWSAACAAGTENAPYDWEHCPAFLARKLRERFPDTSDSSGSIALEA
jgi:hypothetical protein